MLLTLARKWCKILIESKEGIMKIKLSEMEKGDVGVLDSESVVMLRRGGKCGGIKIDKYLSFEHWYGEGDNDDNLPDIVIDTVDVLL